MADSEQPTGRTGQRDLTEGPIVRTLMLFALPTLGANVLQSLNASVNAIWIGRFLGEEALAATSNASIIMFLMFAAVFGLALAATVLIGQAMGQGDLDRVRRVLGSSIGLVLSLGVAVCLVGWLATPRILRLLATPPDAQALAVTYLRVIFLGLPVTFLSVLLTSALRGVGDAITPLRVMILNVVLDAGLNPPLILGFGPVPALGIAGSGLATLLAGLISTAILLWVIYAHDLALRLRGAELAYLIPDPVLARTIVTKGVPMGLQMITLSLSMLLMIGLVNREGVHTTAAYGAISQLWGYVQMPALAVGAAASAMAAQNIGAGKWDRVERTAWGAAGINLLMTGILVVLLTFVDRPLLGLFLTPESPAVPIAVRIHLLASWSFLLFGISMVLSSVMRANGAVMVPLLILVVAMFPSRIGFALALHPVLDADALWWAFPFGSTIGAILTAVYYRYGGWRQARMLG